MLLVGCNHCALSRVLKTGQQDDNERSIHGGMALVYLLSVGPHACGVTDQFPMTLHQLGAVGVSGYKDPRRPLSPGSATSPDYVTALQKLWVALDIVLQ